MKNFKSLAGSALIAAVAVGGALASTGSAMAADGPAPAPAKKAAVGPYKCATAIPVISDDMMLGSVYLSCNESKAEDPDTNVHYDSRLFGLELPDKKGPAIGASVLPKAHKAEETPAPGDDQGKPGDQGGGEDTPLPLPTPLPPLG